MQKETNKDTLPAKPTSPLAEKPVQDPPAYGITRLAPVSFRNLFQHVQEDGPAGLVVFFVALPLCLGIALASGAPLEAGIIAGVVGGIVISFFSGSELSVSGPAAGLVVIVSGAITQLGGFNAFLPAVLLAGVIQFAFGYARMGTVVNYVPNSVIKGMLAAIGLLIILKQLPHALGRDADYEGDESFLNTSDGLNTFEELYIAIKTFSPEAVVISGLSLTVLLLWGKLGFVKKSFLQYIPAALIVVVLGIAVNEIARASFTNFYLRPEDGHLVSLPSNGLQGLFTWPDWSSLSNPALYTIAITLAIVASLESLLSLEATDKMDSQKRISNGNRELRAQGIGNFICGLLGGLPVTSVIVRSSANVYAGARTRLSSIIHGVLLLVCVLSIPFFLNKIPLASLAAILLVVGYKLTDIKLLRAMFKEGWAQAVPFFATILAIVLTDLLIGILIGIAVGLYFVLRTHHTQAVTLVADGSRYLMRLNKDVSFLNKTELKRKLMNVPMDSTLVIDAHRALFIDHDIRETIQDYQLSAKYNNIEVELKGFNNFLNPHID